MTYESKSFKEHHLTRLPVLERLLLLGWEREQIICPSPNSDDTEWHVPKTPSEATNRESKRSFKGYPVDIALFDDVEFVNDYEHIVAIIECKEPNKNEGISQLKIYLGLEPHARLGIWTNGTEFVRVYKLPSAGDFKVVEGAGLPKPTENFILAGDKRITYSDLQIPSTRELKSAFSSLLGVLTSRDTRSTRREDQLNQMSNILLIKLESDHDGQWDKNESLLFQLSDSPAQTHKSVNNAFADYKRRHPVLFATDEPDAPIDPFYLFWAMRLRDVQNQWQRVIFMQTNREDLGNRYRLIEIPYTDDKIAAKNVSQCYRDYFLGLYELQRKFDHMSDDF